MQPTGREALGPSRSSANRDRRRSSDLGFFCSAEGRLTGGAGRAGRGGEGTRPGYRTLLSNTPLLKGRVESEALLGGRLGRAPLSPFKGRFVEVGLLLPRGVAWGFPSRLSAHRAVTLALVSRPLGALPRLLRPVLLPELFPGSPVLRFLRRSVSLLFPLLSLALGHMVDLRSSLFLCFLFVLLSSDFAGRPLAPGVHRVLLVAGATGGSFSVSLFIRFFCALSVRGLFV